MDSSGEKPIKIACNVRQQHVVLSRRRCKHRITNVPLWKQRFVFPVANFLFNPEDHAAPKRASLLSGGGAPGQATQQSREVKKNVRVPLMRRTREEVNASVLS